MSKGGQTMEYKKQKWYEVSYQRIVYGAIHHNEDKRFYDLKEAYEYANEIKERFPRGRVWIDECTLEKKEIE